MNVIEESEQSIVFLGVSESVNIRSNLFLDILGCSFLMPVTTIPAVLSNRFVIVGIKNGQSDVLHGTSFVLRSDDNPKSYIKIDVNAPDDSVSGVSSVDISKGEINTLKDGAVEIFRGRPDSAGYCMVPLPLSGFCAICQGKYSVFHVTDTGESLVGSFDIVLSKSPEITPEKIASILLQDKTSKSIQMKIGCSKCNKYAYSGIKFASDAVINQEDGMDYLPYESLDGDWSCDCGGVTVALQDFKQSIQNAVNQDTFNTSLISEPVSVKFLKMRHRSVLARFTELMNSSVNEADYQKFFEENPTVWGWLSPSKIVRQPKILTDFVADFGILNINQELILIEIERPNSRLITGSGNFAADAQHAIDQTRDWRHAIERERSACLKSMGFENEVVRAIKYVVIAGMKRNVTDHARFDSRIKSGMPNDTSFYTFDEMELFVRASIDGLISSVVD